MIADNITVIGNDHVFKNIECQDSSDSWKGDGYCAVIVCDGHGGPKYIRSKKGSETACKVGRSAIEEFMEGLRKEVPPAEGGNPFLLDNEDCDRQLIQLERAIILRWNEAVRDHLEKNPIEDDPRFDALSDTHKKSLERTGERAYGTTFIAAVLTEYFCFAVKLGDGNIAMLSNEGGFFPDEFPYNPWDFNGTYSMCDSDADAMFSHCFYENTPSIRIDGVTIMSDGAVNSFNSMGSYVKFISNVFEGYKEDEFAVAHDELEDALNRFTKNGSGDDISIGIIIKPCEAFEGNASEDAISVSGENEKRTKNKFDIMKSDEEAGKTKDLFDKADPTDAEKADGEDGAKESIDVEEAFDESDDKIAKCAALAEVSDDESSFDVLNKLLEGIDDMIKEAEKALLTKDDLFSKNDTIFGIIKNNMTEKIAISRSLWRYIERTFPDPYKFLECFVIAESSSEEETDEQSSANDGN